MQPDRRRSAALRRPVPASAGAPSPSRGRFGAPRGVLVPGQGGVAYRDARPPSDAEAAPPPEDGGQEAPGGAGPAPGAPPQPQDAPAPYGPGPYGAPPQGMPQYGPGPQGAPPQGPQGAPGDGGRHGGQQDGDPGNGQQGGQGDQGDGQGNGQNGGQDQPPPPWGSQWSSHQPPPGHGSWGGGDQGQPGPGGPGGPQDPGPGQGPGGSGDGQGPDRKNGKGDGPGGNLRWDPTDPVQRRSRYALLAGMWGFFFALFNWWPLALLLGALALYWGIDALRGKSRQPGNAAGGNGRPTNPGGTDAFGQPVQRQAKGGRPHTTAAITGIVAAGITLSIVLIGFSVQIAYRDYFNCRSDALTEASKDHCSNELPKPLRTFFERD